MSAMSVLTTKQLCLPTNLTKWVQVLEFSFLHSPLTTVHKELELPTIQEDAAYLVYSVYSRH